MRVVGRRDFKRGVPDAGLLPELGRPPIAPQTAASARSVRASIDYGPPVLSTIPKPPITS
jgi:hypothetical protein